MARTSERFRRRLREFCLRLVEAGFSCLPRWIESKMPAVRRGESYAAYLVRPPDPETDKWVFDRFMDPGVGGVVVAAGVGGLVFVDYDVPKVEPGLHAAALGAARRYPVYAELRASEEGLRGWHFALLLPPGALARSLAVEHGYGAEFAVRTAGVVAVHPGVLVEGGVFSAYLRVSPVGLAETLYDERLDTLPRLVGDLGGRLVAGRAEKEPAAAVGGSPGVRRWPGRLLRLDPACVLKEIAELLGCRGLREAARALSRGEPPLPYFIYSTRGPARHPRSSWTILETVAGEILAAVGADEETLAEAVELFRRAEEAARRRSPWIPGDHDPAQNLRRGYELRGHGHDVYGYCVLAAAGLCVPSPGQCPGRLAAVPVMLGEMPEVVQRVRETCARR